MNKRQRKKLLGPLGIPKVRLTKSQRRWLESPISFSKNAFVMACPPLTSADIPRLDILYGFGRGDGR